MQDRRWETANLDELEGFAGPGTLLEAGAAPLRHAAYGINAYG